MLLNGFTLTAQERINREPIQFDTSFATIYFDSLPYYEYDHNTGQWDSIMASEGYGDYREFNSFCFKRYTRNEEIFYLLVVNKTFMKYEYPHTQVGPYYFKQTECYIYPEKEYNKLDNDSGIIELQHIESFDVKLKEYSRNGGFAADSLISSCISNNKLYTMYDNKKYYEYFQKNKNRIEMGFTIKRTNENDILFVPPYARLHADILSRKHFQAKIIK